MKLEFPTYIFENYPSIIFHENTVRTELFHADTEGQTGMTKLIAALHSFANAPKNM